MFKKILLGLIILTFIIFLSYIKTERENKQKAMAFEKGQTEAGHENTEIKKELDSLNEYIENKEQQYAENTEQLNSEYGQKIDSLGNLIDSKDAQIDNLKNKLQDTQKNAQNSETTSKTLSQHEKVYRYYKSRYASLPNDLSEYEKKIAIKEIRDETARKFSITLAELNKIRDEYNLSY